MIPPAVEDTGDGTLFTRGCVTVDRKFDAGAWVDALAWQALFDRPKRVLVACEFSATVRDAFRARGFDAWSVDLLPTEGDPRWHIEGDALNVAYSQCWDLLIAHPPCTYLSFAANHCWDAPGREELRQEAMAFFLALYNAPVGRVCIENPVGFPNRVFRKPDQTVHPVFFGEAHFKRTCFWLRNLPLLTHRPTDELFGPRTHGQKPEPVYIDKSGKARHWTEAGNSGHARSKTHPALANAMADQWGHFLNDRCRDNPDGPGPATTFDHLHK